MVGPLDILEPGGDLIVASACSEGMGSKHYVEAQRRLVDLGPDRFQSSIEGETALTGVERASPMSPPPSRTAWRNTAIRAWPSCRKDRTWSPCTPPELRS
jgi:hypothetical protein